MAARERMVLMGKAHGVKGHFCEYDPHRSPWKLLESKNEDSNVVQMSSKNYKYIYFPSEFRIQKSALTS